MYNDTLGNLLDDNGFGQDSDLDNDTLSVVSGTFTTANGAIDISANGDFTYTPDTGFLGVDSYTYTLQDGQGGTDTATVSINVLQTIPEDAPQLDFTGATFLSYNGSQDAGGTISVIENGAGVEIEGNAWKKIALDYVVTQNTVINFEYKSENQGEIQGFGLETDNDYSTGANNFQLYGVDSPTSFIGDFDYVESKIWQSFSVDIGRL